MITPQLLTNGPANSAKTVILAHGAGAPMDSPFMNYFAERLAESGLRVVRFEFPYMAARRTRSKSGPPDREPVLREAWLGVIQQFASESLVIGGKSMGGRTASLIADQADVAGLVCLGYPFHPTGQPNKRRVEHLRSLHTPTLIVQGERDPFGNRDDVQHYELSANITIRWLIDGDHSFKPRVRSGRTEEENWREAVSWVVEFANHLS